MSCVNGVTGIEIFVRKHRILTQFCTAFERPQTCTLEECCVFIGHEYNSTHYLVESYYFILLNTK